ncbi:MAG: two-component system response regulator [Geobacteraceae bacterium GWC2_58_44]|nr:MAG: two-component system response regulator [Geobacteraceae bacterium GWC2_58_44]HBG04043.1 two-component system response regulator [Geobacter sp.]
MKTPLGELLVESGIITVKTLERALTRQQGSGKRLGIVLDEMGVITQEELIDALAQQFGFETVKGIASLDFPARLLELIPEEIAVRKLVFPLRREDGVLALAVTDPFDTDTIEFLEKQNATTIVPVLATREDILDAVNLHYPGSEAAGNRTVKVLVVDGSSELTAEIEGALRREGYQVLTANDGVEGLRIAFSEQPELILCDAALPRMDGYALMRAIKANPTTAGTPMILITSKTSQEEEHRALKSGFHDFIAKPMMTVRVVSRVKRALEMTQQAKQRQTAPPL